MDPGSFSEFFTVRRQGAKLTFCGVFSESYERILTKCLEMWGVASGGFRGGAGGGAAAPLARKVAQSGPLWAL